MIDVGKGKLTNAEKVAKNIHLEPPVFDMLTKVCKAKKWNLKNYLETLANVQAKNECLMMIKTQASPEIKREWQQLEKAINDLRKRQQALLIPIALENGLEPLLEDLGII